MSWNTSKIVSVDNLNGCILDFFIGWCFGKQVVIRRFNNTCYIKAGNTTIPFHPSSRSMHGLPLLENASVSLTFKLKDDQKKYYLATCPFQGQIYEAEGPTILIAAMRCIVKSFIGDEIDISWINTE